MTVSTVDATGAPDSRFVLVRGADERGFVFYTNYESTKSRSSPETRRCRGVFGWLDLHRQVRVRGSVERVDRSESDAYFAPPRGSQIGAWASPQSRSIADRAELDRRVASRAADSATDASPRPQYWGGWRLVPENGSSGKVGPTDCTTGWHTGRPADEPGRHSVPVGWGRAR